MIPCYQSLWNGNFRTTGFSVLFLNMKTGAPAVIYRKESLNHRGGGGVGRGDVLMNII